MPKEEALEIFIETGIYVPKGVLIITELLRGLILKNLLKMKRKIVYTLF